MWHNCIFASLSFSLLLYMKIDTSLQLCNPENPQSLAHHLITFIIVECLLWLPHLCLSFLHYVTIHLFSTHIYIWILIVDPQTLFLSLFSYISLLFYTFLISLSPFCTYSIYSSQTLIKYVKGNKVFKWRDAKLNLYLSMKMSVVRRFFILLLQCETKLLSLLLLLLICS